MGKGKKIKLRVSKSKWKIIERRRLRRTRNKEIKKILRIANKR
jgi:hypothetical protein